MPLVFILIVSLVFCSYLYLFCKRTDIVLHIDDVEGDISYLKDVKISGDITDSDHTIAFSMCNDEIDKSLYYGIFNDNRYSGKKQNSDYSFGYEIPSNANTKTVKTADGYEAIWSDKYVMYIQMSDISTEKIKTDVVVKYGEMTSGVQNYAHSQTSGDTGLYNYFLSTENGKYVVTYTDGFCRGTGGIYKVAEKVDDEFETLKNPKNVFPIDLNNGRTRILYGDTAGNKIILILAKTNALYMTVFDTEQNKLLYEIEFGEISDSDYFYSSSNNDYFIVRHENDTTGKNYFTVLNLDDGSIAEQTTMDMTNDYGVFIMGDINQKSNVSQIEMLYRNNALIILFNCKQYEYNLHSTISVPIVKIFAFQNGKKKLECVLNSNIEEDSYQDKNLYNGAARVYKNMKLG